MLCVLFVALCLCPILRCVQVHDGTYTPADQFLKDPDSLCSTVTWKDEEDRVIWVYRIQVGTHTGSNKPCSTPPPRRVLSGCTSSVFVLVVWVCQHCCLMARVHARLPRSITCTTLPCTWRWPTPQHQAGAQ